LKINEEFMFIHQNNSKELGNEMVTFIFGEVTVDADVKVK
jgi:hypothetical protein